MKRIKPIDGRYCPFCGADMYAENKEDDKQENWSNHYSLRIELWTGRSAVETKDLQNIEYHMCTKCRLEVGREIEKLLNPVRRQEEMEPGNKKKKSTSKSKAIPKPKAKTKHKVRTKITK